MGVFHPYLRLIMLLKHSKIKYYGIRTDSAMWLDEVILEICRKQ